MTTRQVVALATRNRGFTLIELLVVIAIIGILASVVLAALGGARDKARDARRLSDLKELEKAVELYATYNSSYPTTGGQWRGTCSNFGSHTTSGANGWIPNLAPQFISILPTDPKPVGTSGCYLYNSNGRDYIILAYGTVETYTAANNPSPRPIEDGNAATCPSSTTYTATFAKYTSGAQCW